MLLAVSYDGALKMWDNKLQLVSAVKCAHGGARVHCLAIGPDGNLYTGGDDKVRWPAMLAGHSARYALQRQAACARRGQRCVRIIECESSRGWAHCARCQKCMQHMLQSVMLCPAGQLLCS